MSNFPKKLVRIFTRLQRSSKNNQNSVQRVFHLDWSSCFYALLAKQPNQRSGIDFLVRYVFFEIVFFLHTALHFLNKILSNTNHFKKCNPLNFNPHNSIKSNFWNILLTSVPLGSQRAADRISHAEHVAIPEDFEFREWRRVLRWSDVY